MTFIFVIIFFLIPMPFYAVFPGGIVSLDKSVNIHGDSNRSHFLAIYSNIYENPYGFLTSNDFEINLFIYVISKLKSDVDLHSIPDGYENITTQEIKDYQYSLLNESIMISKHLARNFLGINDTEVNISFGELAGSSGSLMMTLEIINQLGDEDLIKNRRIAGTGELDWNGTVLEIGGLFQKLKTAEKNNIDVLLIPKANEQDAIESSVEVVFVENLSDAVKKLKDS